MLLLLTATIGLYCTCPCQGPGLLVRDRAYLSRTGPTCPGPGLLVRDRALFICYLQYHVYFLDTVQVHSIRAVVDRGHYDKRSILTSTVLNMRILLLHSYMLKCGECPTYFPIYRVFSNCYNIMFYLSPILI